MKRKMINLIFLILSIIFFSIKISAKEKLSVLFISSYSPNFPTFIEHYKGINEVFDSQKFQIHMEYLDTKEYPTGEIRGKIEEILLMKLNKNFNYDTVITADDNALHFIEKYYSDFFQKIPVVFFGVNDEKYAKEMGEKPNITGIIEDISIAENFELIEKLYSKSRLYIISDNTISGKSDLKRIEEHLNENNYQFSYEILSLEKLTWLELEEKLKIIDADPLLLLSAYEDKVGVNKNFDESIELIMRNSEGAVFHFWKHGLEEGILGGVLVDHYRYVKQASKIAEFMISKKKKPRLDVVKGKNIHIINYKTMKRLKIRESSFPKETEFINKPTSIIDNYMLLIVLMIVILFFASIYYTNKN